MEDYRTYMFLSYFSSVPRIILFRGGRHRWFTLDTAADTSVMCLETAEYWGLLEDVVPITENNTELEDVRGHLVVDLYTDEDILIPLNHFIVADCNYSVVGLDFLFQHQCKIILDQDEPEIQFFEPQLHSISIMNEFFSDDQPRILVNLDVNSRLTQVQFDTSFTGFIAGRTEDAEDLDLELKDLEEPVSFRDLTHYFESKRGCDDVSIQFENIDRTWTFHLIEGQNLICPIVGIQFLIGATLKFWASSDSIGFDFHYPQDDPT